MKSRAVEPLSDRAVDQAAQEAAIVAIRDHGAIHHQSIGSNAEEMGNLLSAASLPRPSSPQSSSTNNQAKAQVVDSQPSNSCKTSVSLPRDSSLYPVSGTDSQTSHPRALPKELVRHGEESLASRCTKLQTDNVNLKRQVGTLTHHLDLTEKDLVKAKSFRRAAKNHEQEAVRLKAELDHAMQQNEQLAGDLGKCKEQILWMQPFKQSSEIEITELYHDLCGTIESWCEKQFGDMEELGAAVCNLQWSTEHLGILQEYLCQHKELEVVQAFPETSVHMIMHMTMFNLFTHIFHGSWVIGMPETNKILIRSMLEGMKNLQPARNSGVMGVWRSEAYRALFQIPEYVTMHQNGLKNCTRVMEEIFARLSGVVTDEGFDCKGLQDITTTAAKLASKIATASDRYSMKYSFRPSHSTEARQLYTNMLGDYSLIDIETGQTVTSAFTITSRKDGRVGEMLAVILPALERVQEDVMAVIVVKSTILVRFDQPVQRKGRAKAKGKGESM